MRKTVPANIPKRKMMNFKIYNDNKYDYSIVNYLLDNIHDSNYIVFDLEATGLDTVNDRITQIGMVEFNHGKIANEYNYLINPRKTIPENIELLTGITNEQVKGKPVFKEVWPNIYNKFKDHIWVAQCGFEYDFKLIETECRINDIKLPEFKMLDTKIMFAYLFQDIIDTFSTDYFVKYYDINVDGLKRHSALDDAIIILKILQQQLNDYKKRSINSINIKTGMKINKFVLS